MPHVGSEGWPVKRARKERVIDLRGLVLRVRGRQVGDRALRPSLPRDPNKITVLTLPTPFDHILQVFSTYARLAGGDLVEVIDHPSSARLTFIANSVNVKGFCRSAMSGSSRPWWTMAL
jgi:hypothetical protein